MTEPLRLVHDPEVSSEVAQDVREAIHLGVSGPDVPLDSVMDRLDTTISILMDGDDVEDDDDAEIHGPLTTRAGSAPGIVTALLLLAMGFALALLIGLI